MPEPSDWSWTKEASGWQHIWTTLPEASDSCHELIHCGCKKGALDDARVPQLNLSALHCASALETVDFVKYIYLTLTWFISHVCIILHVCFILHAEISSCTGFLASSYFNF